MSTLVLASAIELGAELSAARGAARQQRQRAPELAAFVCAAEGPVALVDIGFVGYACPARALIDLGGLTDPAIAYARGGHLSKQLDERALEARAPARIVLHSRERPRFDGAGRLRWFAGYPVERAVLAMGFVQRDFALSRVLASGPSNYYLLLVRRRPEGRQ